MTNQIQNLNFEKNTIGKFVLELKFEFYHLGF